MIRSTPSSSGSGNMTPASTTIVVSSHVSASMFMPNSPTPPSATTSSIKEQESQTRPDELQAEQVRRGEPHGRRLVRLLGAPESSEAGCLVGAGPSKLRPTYKLRRNYSTAHHFR